MPRLPLRLWRPTCAVGDLLLATLALLLAYEVRVRVPLPFTRDLLPSDRLDGFAAVIGAVLVAQALALYLFGFYDPPGPRPDNELSRRLLPAVALATTGIATYLFLAGRPFPRSVVVIWALFDGPALWAWRAALRRLVELPRRRVAVVGCGEPGREIAELLRDHPWTGLELVGHVPIPEPAAPAGGKPLDATAAAAKAGTADVADCFGPRLGTLADLPALLESGQVDDLILTAPPDSWQIRVVDQLAGLRPAHTNILLLPGPFEALIGRTRYRSVHDVPLIEVVRETEWRNRFPVKRLLDLAGAALLLLLAVPVMGLVALAVRLTSPGPALYRQSRVGRGRREFVLLKFRTMVSDAERVTGEILASANDPRLTSIGALLRRTRLDELPQLWNVLAGEMSLVGPRPERPGFVQRFLAEVPGYAERFSVAPGVTGLAQVAGDYHSSARNKLRYDLAYLANWSLWLDLSILLRTVKIVLTSRGV